MTDTTDSRAMVERFDRHNPMRTADVHDDTCTCSRCLRDALAAAQDRIEALEAQQENAVQAMAETHNSWEARCYAIMAMLEQDFGGFSTDAPDVGSWYEMNSRRLQKRIEELEAVNKRLREALRKIDAAAFNDNGEITYNPEAMRRAYFVANRVLKGDDQ